MTEDLVFMLQAMGVETDIDLEALLKVREIVAEALPGEPLYGFTPDAGLPLGFASPSQMGRGPVREGCDGSDIPLPHEAALHGSPPQAGLERKN